MKNCGYNTSKTTTADASSLCHAELLDAFIRRSQQQDTVVVTTLKVHIVGRCLLALSFSLLFPPEKQATTLSQKERPRRTGEGHYSHKKYMCVHRAKSLLEPDTHRLLQQLRRKDKTNTVFIFRHSLETSRKSSLFDSKANCVYSKVLELLDVRTQCCVITM